MRLRNIPGARDAIAASPWVIHEPEKKCGLWKSVFENDHPLHLEIGTGKGRFIMQLAQEHPEINYIGIEKYSSVLLRCLEKQEELQLQNLVFIRGDAELLNTYFAEGEIEKIYLNFSDPWPKERHAKRRLTHRNNLKEFFDVMRPGGVIEFKTDNDDLFEFSIGEIEDQGYEILEFTRDLHEEGCTYLSKEFMTEYEERFMTLGKNINYVKFRKPQD